jgi:predicted nucleotidyltransferase component of viral defense system
VLTRYAVERLLYRLSRSEHADRFVLKGAMLFQVWGGAPYRPTRDLDLLGHGDCSISGLEQVFRQICEQPVEDDALEFRADTVRAERIREGEQYEGVRLRLVAGLARARIPIQVDVGVGDRVTPSPQPIEYPTLLDLPAPQLRAYTRESVIAEKYQAMVMLGMVNTRMKDFYDLWVLAHRFEFQGPLLAQAIRATFAARRTDFPDGTPRALSGEFVEDAAKQTQWLAFLQKSGLPGGPSTLAEVAGTLRRFLMPPTERLCLGQPFDMSWAPGGPWTPSDFGNHEA